MLGTTRPNNHERKRGNDDRPRRRDDEAAWVSVSTENGDLPFVARGETTEEAILLVARQLSTHHMETVDALNMYLAKHPEEKDETKD